MDSKKFKLNKIGVIMLGVQDLGRSIAFYQEKLGLALQTQFEDFAFFDAGGVTLVLSGLLARLSAQKVGATEVVFSVEDVTGAYEALKERGVSFTHAPRVVSGPNWAANFRDPDGHGLSIFGPEHKP